MKQVLSLLVAFVFLQTHTWALVGGPFDGGGSSNVVVGTYAGVMVGDVAVGGVAGSGALGLFTLGIPATGIGQGVFAIFSGGVTIVGDALALGDPDAKTIQGVMTGDYTYIITGVRVVATLGAQFNATVTGGGGNSFQANNTGVRINGTAAATSRVPTDVFGAYTESSSTFTVVGYKQSNDGGDSADVSSIGQGAP